MVAPTPCPTPQRSGVRPTASANLLEVHDGLPPRPGVAAMSWTERLTERAITFAIAESDEDLAVAHLAFLAHGGRPALDVTLDACLARRD